MTDSLQMKIIVCDNYELNPRVKINNNKNAFDLNANHPRKNISP